MHASRVLSLTAAATLFGAALTLAPGAEAAVHTSTGLRCTIVGKPGPDHLRGTSHRDVICGRGGNDVIEGLGGNDVIDGGAGNDTLAGGVGNDRLLGGLGNDVLSGQAGNDAITAATGNDRVDAGTGNDVVSAGAGNDTVASGTGNDRVSGGAGNDTETGSTGNDVLLGESGDDDLSGQAGNDTINGGSGTNWCDAVSTDKQTACKSDLEAPQVVSAQLSRSAVDVTKAPATFTITAHVTDDTGVRSVDGGSLVSGTVRDGWWRRNVVIPRFTLPGPADYYVSAIDRVGRNGWKPEPLTVQVADATPDGDAPQVRSVSLSPTTVDVRGGARRVTATVRVTDAVAGLFYGHVCLNKSVDGQYLGDGACPSLELVSGDAQDGVYRASLVVPAGATSGTWNVSVSVHDRGGNEAVFYGSDMYAAALAGCQEGCTLGSVYPIPSGAGRLAVVGTGQDAPPLLRSMTLSPADVDSRQGAVLETVTFHATDDIGVTGVGLDAHMDGDPGQVWLFSGEATLVGGTVKDGTWELSVTIPGGAAPGTYVLQAYVQDKDRMVSWFSPDYNLDGVQRLTPELAPNGAVITVQ